MRLPHRSPPPPPRPTHCSSSGGLPAAAVLHQQAALAAAAAPGGGASIYIKGMPEDADKLWLYEKFARWACCRGTCVAACFVAVLPVCCLLVVRSLCTQAVAVRQACQVALLLLLFAGSSALVCCLVGRLRRLLLACLLLLCHCCRRRPFALPTCLACLAEEPCCRCVLPLAGLAASAACASSLTTRRAGATVSAAPCCAALYRTHCCECWAAHAAVWCAVSQRAQASANACGEPAPKHVVGAPDSRGWCTAPSLHPSPCRRRVCQLRQR